MNTLNAGNQMSDMIDAGELKASVHAPNELNHNVGMTTRVVRASFWILGGQGMTMLASLIATPFVIRLLGTEAYGVLALINLLIGYLAFSDLGMGTASTRFGADAHARGDDEGENAVIWTSLLISLGPALLTALVLTLIARPLIAQVLHLPVDLHQEAVIALRLASIGFVARVVAGVMNTPQLVRLKMDLYTAINTGSNVVQICLAPVALMLGGGLVSITLIVTLVSVITALIHAAASKQLLSRLLRPQINLALVRPLARFGAGVIISYLVVMVLINAEKILIARFFSVITLAHYSVAYTLASMLSAMPIAAGQSLIPAFTRLKSDAESLHQLYIRALRGMLLWIAPAAAVVCGGAEPFLTLWAGPEYGRESTLPLYVLVVGTLINAPSHVPYSLLMAWGKTGLIARYHLAQLLPYLLCMAVLTYWFGAVGAAFAWSLRIIIDSLLLFRAVQRNSAISILPLLTNWPGYVVALVSLIIMVLLIRSIALWPALQIAMIIISLAGYAAIIWGWVLKSEERAWMGGIVLLHWRAVLGRG